MGYMLETRGLTKRFGRGDQAQDAVADVSLRIREGEVYGLLGPNGAGKSTTLKMICGMLRPTAGEVARHELAERAVEELAHLEELVHLRLAPLGLPLRDALAGDAEQHGQLFLGHVALRAQVLEVVSEARRGASHSTAGRQPSRRSPFSLPAP